MSVAQPQVQQDPEGQAPPDPCTESEDQQERLRARRMRIAARVEAKRREALGEDPNADKNVKPDLRKSHKQIQDSTQRLHKLVNDGTQFVTNIQVAADARETQRRADEEELKRQRFEKLDNEAKASMETFEDITNKWITAKKKQVPQDIWEVLNAQQQQCAQLIEEKNKLISELQHELKGKDDQYVKDLRKQAEDIDLLIERMEDQIKNLTKTYREELLQIEKSFELERRELLVANRNKWEKGMQSRRDQELEYLLARMRKVEEHEEQLKHLRVQDAEEYNIIKIKLETDVQILEQQLQQMKATYQLNQEKLEYNFQVLKKRDEENNITKSQQKRKITRVQDILNKLRTKMDKQIKHYQAENHTLSEDYKKTVEAYKQVQKKMRHFASAEAKRFQEIWLMNEEEMKELVKKALEVDRIIYEQQLGMPWTPPDLWFMKTKGPLSQQQTTKKSAHQLLVEVMSSGGEEVSQPCDEDDSDDSVSNGEKIKEDSEEHGQSSDHPQISAKTVKQILEILCDESGFLMEKKLHKLLAPLEKDERSLMKLDAIFVALGIDSEDDVYKLVDFILKYRAEPVPSEEAKEDGSETGPAKQARKCTKLCKSRSSELVHPNDVLQALREFVMNHKMKSGKHSQPKLAHMETRDCSRDVEFWEAMAQIIPESRLKEWDALEAALFKYHHVLSSRSKLLNDTASLGQQNSELRLLLHQYLNAKINSELEVPPAQVLQLDSSQT